MIALKVCLCFKDRLTQAPVLAFTDSQLPYVLHVDVCCEGLGEICIKTKDRGYVP